MIRAISQIETILSEAEEESVEHFIAGTSAPPVQRNKNFVKQYFEYEISENSEKVGKCLLCKQNNVIKYIKMKDRNTTGLKKHLLSWHPDIYSIEFGNINGPNSKSKLNEILNTQTQTNGRHSSKLLDLSQIKEESDNWEQQSLEQSNNEDEHLSQCENSPSVSSSKQNGRKRMSSAQLSKTLINKLQKLTELRDADDEFDLFGKIIAMQLRKMPMRRALICQEKLQSVITEERLSQLNS